MHDIVYSRTKPVGAYSCTCIYLHSVAYIYECPVHHDEAHGLNQTKRVGDQTSISQHSIVDRSRTSDNDGTSHRGRSAARPFPRRPSGPLRPPRTSFAIPHCEPPSLEVPWTTNMRSGPVRAAQNRMVLGPCRRVRHLCPRSLQRRAWRAALRTVSERGIATG